MEATFYADVGCSTARGEPVQYSMSEVLEAYGIDNCIVSSSYYQALRCINGVLSSVLYNPSDTTCSSGFLLASAAESSSCSASIFGVGSYMVATCSEPSSIDYSDTSTGDSEASTDEDDSSDGSSPLLAVGGGGFSWSTVATATAVFAAALG